METLNNTIKSCETLLQSNNTHNRQIAQQFEEMGHKIKNEITIGIDESRRIKNEFINIEEALNEMKWQMNNIDLQLTQIDDIKFLYESPKKKQASRHHLSNVSRGSIDEAVTKDTKTTTKSYGSTHGK